MTKRTVSPEIKRVYIIVPETVTVPIPRTKKTREVRMEAGRLSFQAVHAALRMQAAELRLPQSKAAGYGDVTGAMLSVRNSKELDKVARDLAKWTAEFGIPPFRLYTFEDENSDFYGTTAKVLTAICLSPVERSIVDPVIGHLEPYKDPFTKFQELLS